MVTPTFVNRQKLDREAREAAGQSTSHEQIKGIAADGVERTKWTDEQVLFVAEEMGKLEDGSLLDQTNMNAKLVCKLERKFGCKPHFNKGPVWGLMSSIRSGKHRMFGTNTREYKKEQKRVRKVVKARSALSPSSSEDWTPAKNSLLMKLDKQNKLEDYTSNAERLRAILADYKAVHPTALVSFESIRLQVSRLRRQNNEATEEAEKEAGAEQARVEEDEEGSMEGDAQDTAEEEEEDDDDDEYE
ncbi:hypothetical protein JCM11641_002587 [Rhodosporidiobolus odoratus]